MIASAKLAEAKAAADVETYAAVVARFKRLGAEAPPAPWSTDWARIERTTGLTWAAFVEGQLAEAERTVRAEATNAARMIARFERMAGCPWPELVAPSS